MHRRCSAAHGGRVASRLGASRTVDWMGGEADKRHGVQHPRKKLEFGSADC